MTKRICAKVSLSALKNNIDEVAKKAGGKEVIAVIKADAYGHGAKEAAKVFSDVASFFAVATGDEALELRSFGVEKDILILAPVPFEDTEPLIKGNITMTVSDLSMAEEISKKAVKMGEKAKIHVAIDSGMNRIGFTPTEDSLNEILKIAALPNIALEGVFTHFAKADESDKTTLNRQSRIFEDFCAILREKGLKLKEHSSNSAAIMEKEIQPGSAVRTGVVLYGLYPSDEVNKKALSLIPALTWLSRVSFVKDVKKGEGISYGHTFIADSDMKVATISAGYGDGYPRLLSNKGRVLINGESCPIVGRVCMDQFMVDVTGKNVNVDDEVVLMGKSGNDEITADEIAHLTGTINYEVVCDIGKRVPRIYE